MRRFDDPSKTGKGWDDAFYLFPIPKNDLSLNSNLKQNPGWEKY
ncbi:MAG: RagB/SusD family nutrient uptake outer membrane protein [Bacteroidales bacterium]|nr:RagB/SusD family nutrient uptake outer membrane protein [Bacteroidales bacterium]